MFGSNGNTVLQLLFFVLTFFFKYLTIFTKLFLQTHQDLSSFENPLTVALIIVAYSCFAICSLLLHLAL